MRALLVLLAALALAAPALAAAPAADAHDRALARQLAARVSTLRALDARTSDTRLQQTLESCPALKKNPSQMFAAVFVLLPVLVVDVVNRYRPQLTSLRDSLAGMHPDDAVFARYLALVHDSLGLILRFDNRGKKIDYCRALTVLLDPKATASDYQAVLGVDPAQLPSLTTGRAAVVSKELKRLEPKMQAFFVAAGLPPKTAAALASSG